MDESRVLSSTHISAILMDAGVDEYTAGGIGVMLYQRIYGPTADQRGKPTLPYSEAVRRLEEGLIAVQDKNRQIIEQCGKALELLKFRNIMQNGTQP